MWQSSDSEADDDQPAGRQGRVRDLAKRFDTIRAGGKSGHVPTSPLRRQKRVASGAKPPQIASKAKSSSNTPSPPSSTTSVKLNVGILRKRSSMLGGGANGGSRRRTRSALDVSTPAGCVVVGVPIVSGTSSIMRKSQSAHDSIVEETTSGSSVTPMGQPVSIPVIKRNKPTLPTKPSRLQLKRTLDSNLFNSLPSPDCYETLITPSSSAHELAPRSPSPMKSPRFERRNHQFSNSTPPAPPAQPPPSPPKLSQLNGSRSGSSGDIYEEIAIAAVNFRKFKTNANGLNNNWQPDGGAIENSRTIKTYLQTDQLMIESQPQRRSMFRSLYSASKNASLSQSKIKSPNKATKSRPKSSASIEFDRLLRIKSDIQLNITKKVGQIKLRVTSAATQHGISREHKAASTSQFYVDRGETASLSNGALQFPIDDRDACIYGDDWSSEEEEEWITDREEDADTVVNCTNKGGAECTSMLSEIEAELEKRCCQKAQLPDLVPTGSDLSIESSSTTPENAKSIVTTLNLTDLLQDNRENFSDAIGCRDEESLCSEYGIISSPEKNQQPVYTSRLPDTQPLYQIYMMQHQQQQTNDIAVLLATTGEEEVVKLQRHPSSSASSEDSGRGADCSSTTVSSSQVTSSTSMRRERLVAASDFGSQRSLWCELPEVRSAGLLDRLDDESKKLQEAFFEVITSEASYLRSLNILITHFMAAPEMLGSKGTSSVISNVERKHLFSNIFAVRDCSERLLCDLETRLETNLVVDDVCDILCEHLESNFEPYVKYCSNQVYQDRTLRRLKTECLPFMTAVQRLEQDRLCQGLDMRSFLMLPMQRVTRYPLLLIAILDRLPATAPQRRTASRALHLANQAVSSCNEGARRMERTEQLLDVDRRLVYKSPDLKRIPLVSSGRYLVKRGSLTQVVERRAKSLLQNKQRNRAVYLFLFNDILMVTKKKLNGTYVCKDYAARRFVCVEPLELDQLLVRQQPISTLSSAQQKAGGHLFACTLTSNARGKLVEMILAADSETDRERWLSAIRPPTCSNPEEKVYADWDCPQAVVVHRYSADQADELQLEVGQLINILRKMPDGWHYGERVSDGIGGWFPSSYVQQVINDHVRAKNYRDRWRVIQAAATMQQQQQQQQQRRESVTGSSSAATIARRPQFMSRLRRLSNPMAFFQQVN